MRQYASTVALLFATLFVTNQAHAVDVDLQIKCKTDSYWGGQREETLKLRVKFGKNETQVGFLESINGINGVKFDTPSNYFVPEVTTGPIFRMQTKGHGTFMASSESWKFGTVVIPMKNHRIQQERAIRITPKELTFAFFNGTDNKGKTQHDFNRCPLTTAQWYKLEQAHRQVHGTAHMNAPDSTFALNKPAQASNLDFAQADIQSAQAHLAGASKSVNTADQILSRYSRRAN
jgi:hypothetical protein